VSPSAYLARVHELPCVVCLNCKGLSVRCAEAHHVEAYRGDHSDFATVPLCKDCHDLLHQLHRKPFYSLYNIDDIKLLAWTNLEMAK
jgi:hypothetical protein